MMSEAWLAMPPALARLAREKHRVGFDRRPSRVARVIKDTLFGAYSPEYQKRRAAALGRGFVLVMNPAMRRGLVHVVKAETLGEPATVARSGAARSPTATWYPVRGR